MFFDAHSTLVQNRKFIDFKIIQYIVLRKKHYMLDIIVELKLKDFLQFLSAEKLRG